MQSTRCNVQLLWGKGHLEQVCDQQKKGTNQKNGKPRGFGNRRQLVDQDDFGEEDDENYIVPNVEGGSEDTKRNYMEGFTNGNRFRTMIKTVSPVTIFELDKIGKIMKSDKWQVQQKGRR